MLVVDEGSVGPEVLRDFLSRQEFARPLQKHQEDLEGLDVQLNADTLFAKLSRCGVGFKHSEAIAPCLGRGSVMLSRSVYPILRLIRRSFAEWTTSHNSNRCSHLHGEKQSSPREARIHCLLGRGHGRLRYMSRHANHESPKTLDCVRAVDLVDRAQPYRRRTHACGSCGFQLLRERR